MTLADDIDALDPVNNGVMLWYNEHAAPVMADNRIPTVETYSLTINRLGWKIDRFHWNSSGYNLMGTAIADELERVLSVPEPKTASFPLTLLVGVGVGLRQR